MLAHDTSILILKNDEDGLSLKTELLARGYQIVNAREVYTFNALGTIARHERDYIEYVLKQCDGNITRAAKVLGLHRQSLQRKLRKTRPR